MIINELLLEGRKRLSGVTGFCAGSVPDGVFGGVPGGALEGALGGALEAEVLLAHVLGISREELLRDGVSREVPPQDRELFLKYIDEVASGKPVAYITNSKEFYGMDFYVDERVLVPRPETEMVVDEVLDWLGMRAADKEIKMLDIGTGSLNITAAVTRHFGHIYVHAVDVSDEALEVARINREAHGLETHVELYKSDLLSNVDERRFDVITANLPYVGEVRNRNLADNVLKFEPGVALWGGRDGLELYKKMIQQIFDKKIEFDLMVGEFGFGQGRAMRGMLSKFFDQISGRDGSCGGECGGGYKWEIKNDLGGVPRIFVVRRIDGTTSTNV
ncbi:MAG: peptide chain release factor N(5)-glutamine methyltransferase [Candidatus Gracilibacteria bacterium]